jgi:tetraacyldisaccharide-1-P 4'-kinase
VHSPPALSRGCLHGPAPRAGPAEGPQGGLAQRHRPARELEQSLVNLGADLVYSKRFADHHRFTQQEVLNAINRSKKRQAETIITTQKDAVRFPKIDRRDLPIYFMRVEIKILRGANDFQDCVRRICFR